MSGFLELLKDCVKIMNEWIHEFCENPSLSCHDISDISYRDKYPPLPFYVRLSIVKMSISGIKVGYFACFWSWSEETIRVNLCVSPGRRCARSSGCPMGDGCGWVSKNKIKNDSIYMVHFQFAGFSLIHPQPPNIDRAVSGWPTPAPEPQPEMTITLRIVQAVGPSRVDNNVCSAQGVHG